MNSMPGSGLLKPGQPNGWCVLWCFYTVHPTALFLGLTPKSGLYIINGGHRHSLDLFLRRTCLKETMPMSPIDSILGIPGLVVQAVKRTKDIHVWAVPRQRPACVHCAGNQVRIKATHQRTLKHTRQGNKLVVLHLRVPKYHCPDCNRYFRHSFAGILPRLRSTETYRLEVFEAHEGGVSQRKLTHTHRVGSATVERWYQSFIKRRVSELSGRSCPQVLGIDEHFFTRKRGYATTLVDLKNHKVFDVVLGRSEASLRSYMKRLPGKENVRVIVMDLSETYRRIAQQYFPNAVIVADRFHVVRLVNQHFLKLWQQYDPEGRKNRGLLSLMRRHHWKHDCHAEGEPASVLGSRA